MQRAWYSLHMNTAKLKRRIRAMQKNGVTLDKCLAEMPADLSPFFREIATRLWAEVAAEKPRPKTPSYRDAIEFIAVNDEGTNMCDDPAAPDYIGGQPTVVLVAELWGKDVPEVVKAVIAARKKGD